MGDDVEEAKQILLEHPQPAGEGLVTIDDDVVQAFEVDALQHELVNLACLCR